MRPNEVAKSFVSTIRDNLSDLPRRMFIQQLTDLLVPFLKEHYPTPQSLLEAIERDEPIVERACQTVPADKLALARMMGGSVAENTTIDDYDSILAGVGEHLPEHEKVLWMYGEWYVNAMEKARAWFLDVPPAPGQPPS